MRSSSTRDPTKTRCFDVICYDDPKTLLPHFHNIMHYAYILHDRDVHENTGQLKEEHFHLVLVFANPRSLNGFQKEINCYAKQNVFAETVQHSIGASFLYLMHKTKSAIAQGKFQYDERLIFCDDIGFWKTKSSQVCEETNNCFSNEKFIFDLIRYNELQMALVYGRDYIKNAERYRIFKNYLETQFGLDKSNVSSHIGVAIENLM